MAAVTDLPRDPRGSTGIQKAIAAADAAAGTSRVQIRELTTLEELAAVSQLYDAVWRPEPHNPPVTTEWLRALTKAGNYVAGAYTGDQLAAAGVAFFGPPADRAMHSHIAAVADHVRGRRVGFALKVHQRAWAMLRGVSTVAWTFDPLVRRNAYFNIAKLAASPQEYLPNFYGAMHDAINAGGATDRLLVNWRLDSARVSAACRGTAAAVDVDDLRAAGAVEALGISESDEPVPGASDADRLLVAVPADIESLRLRSPGLANGWRAAVGDVLGGLMRDGATVTGFDRAGWYIVDRTTTERPA